MRGGGMIWFAFLMLLFIVALAFVPVIFGSAEQDLNLTVNSTTYNETQNINKIVLVGMEVSPILLVALGIGFVLILAAIALTMTRII